MPENVVQLGPVGVTLFGGGAGPRLLEFDQPGKGVLVLALEFRAGRVRGSPLGNGAPGGGQLLVDGSDRAVEFFERRLGVGGRILAACLLIGLGDRVGDGYGRIGVVCLVGDLDEVAVGAGGHVATVQDVLGRDVDGRIGQTDELRGSIGNRRRLQDGHLVLDVPFRVSGGAAGEELPAAVILYDQRCCGRPRVASDGAVGHRQHYSGGDGGKHPPAIAPCGPKHRVLEWGTVVHLGVIGSRRGQGERLVTSYSGGCRPVGFRPSGSAVGMGGMGESLALSLALGYASGLVALGPAWRRSPLEPTEVCQWTELGADGGPDGRRIVALRPGALGPWVPDADIDRGEGSRCRGAYRGPAPRIASALGPAISRAITTSRWVALNSGWQVVSVSQAPCH